MPRWFARASNLRCAIRSAARSTLSPRCCWTSAKPTASIATTRATKRTRLSGRRWRACRFTALTFASRAKSLLKMTVRSRRRSRRPKHIGPDLDARLFDFLRDILALRTGGKMGAELALTISADFGGGDGKGRRGHRFLFLQPDARAQRSRRRSGLLRHHARGVPRLVPQDASSMAVHDARDLDPRHQAQRRCARPAISSLGRARAMEPRGNRNGPR